METRAHRIAVGSFVIGCIVLFFISIMWFSRMEFGKEKGIFMIHFQGSVSGLRPNEAVKFHGFPIGIVKSISIDPANINVIKVKISIKKPELIRTDSVASIEAQGLTGFSYVQINGGSQDRPILKVKKGDKYPLITSKQSSIERLVNAGTDIVEKVSAIAQQLSEVLNKENSRYLSDSLKNIAKITEEVAIKTQELDKVVTSTQKVIEHFDCFVHDLSKGVSPLLNELTHSSKAIHGLVQQNQKPVGNFVSHGLKEIQDLTRELRQTNKKLEGVLSEFDNSPLQYLSKKPKPGVPIS